MDGDTMNNLWWHYILPSLNNRGPLKKAQSELMALGVDYKDAGRILSEVHSTYVRAAHAAATRYEADR
jgi:hypothetical protein